MDAWDLRRIIESKLVDDEGGVPGIERTASETIYAAGTMGCDIGQRITVLTTDNQEFVIEIKAKGN